MVLMKQSWIFLRGLGRHQHHWGKFAELFREKNPQSEVELLDLRGNGELQYSVSCSTIEDHVRDLRARSKLIKNGQPVHLLGLSLGGMVASLWAAQHPSEVQSLVIMNSSDRSLGRPWDRLRPASYQLLLEVLALTNKPQEIIEEAILDLTTRMLPEKSKKAWAYQFAKYPLTSRWSLLKQLYSASRFEFPDPPPPARTLILCGAQDALVNPEISQRLSEKWNCAFQIHPNAGHDLTLDDPDWVLAQLRDFSENKI
jgi:pimeloyl-ACP methyl ester carboxylesterase